MDKVQKPGNPERFTIFCLFDKNDKISSKLDEE
jgi:hypothetical protein